MRILMHPGRQDLALPNILYALGDPLRLHIVGQLASSDEAMSCGDLQVVKEVAKSTGSHHFKILREAGLIRMTPQGRRVLVALRKEDLEARFPGLLEVILRAHFHQNMSQAVHAAA
jgi:DNA-binding transcriptional ArsR family regulator